MCNGIHDVCTYCAGNTVTENDADLSVDTLVKYVHVIVDV